MIWCVEDDASIRDIVVFALNSTGFQAKGFENGREFLAALETERPELVLLDIMLPGIDGVELLRMLKETPQWKEIPVIMATAKGTEYDKVKSLDIGADDYLVKPFGIMEMVSRVKAVLRRCQPKNPPQLLRCGELTVDLDAHSAAIGTLQITLTYKEFELLRLLLSHPGKVYTRDQLYGEIWGMDFLGETRTVDMHIRTLRQKLGSCGGRIKTVRNVGYLWEAGHGE